jgi:hypothetical protein
LYNVNVVTEDNETILRLSAKWISRQPAVEYHKASNDILMSAIALKNLYITHKNTTAMKCAVHTGYKALIYLQNHAFVY